MEDTPRHSKRRKLDTPSRHVSSPLPPKARTPGSLKRPTRRLLSEHHASSPVAGNGSPVARRNLKDDKDVFDDFDGALDSPAKRFRDRVREQLYESEQPPKQAGSKPKEIIGRKRSRTDTRSEAANGTPRGGRTPQTAVSKRKDGTLRGGDEATATNSEDELAAGFLTPSRRKVVKDLTNGTNGNTTPLKSSTRTSTRTSTKVQPNERGSPSPFRANQRRQPRKKPSEDVATEAEDPDLVDANADVEQVVLALAPEGPNLNTARKARANGRRTRSHDDHDENGTSSPILEQQDSVNGRRKRNRADHNENGTTSTLVDRHELGIELGGTAETEEKQDELVLDHINGNMQDNYDQSDHAAESAEALEDTNPFISTRAKGQPATSLSKDTQADLNTVLDVLKNIVMQRLTAKRPIPLLGLDAEYKNVYQLVENTVSAGEGNSMLLIGARGSGKSALVSQVLSEISKEYRQDFHTVKLNGFIHTDDKLALRDIWRQLGKEMELEEDSMGKNYADTLSKLLALLSHPSEQIGEDTEQVAKAVVFVMDEFDLFALHPRQTLLYNLFDIAQSRKAPITVLGLTTRVDVSEGLEKRVKSRFSHRYVHLSLPKTFSAFQEVCKAALLLQLDELSVEERAVLTTSTLPTPKKVKHLDPIDILAAWNSCISTLFATNAFTTLYLAPIYYRSKSIKEALTSLLTPVALLTPTNFPPSPSAFFAQPPTSTSLSHALAPPDSKLAILTHLSHVQLALLIAAARLDVILDTDTCNFNMAYAEYVSLAAKARMQNAAGGAVASGGATRVWGKEVAMREWERLVRWELVVPVVGLGAGAGAAGAMVRVDVALEEIVPSVVAGGGQMDRVLEKWCRQI